MKKAIRINADLYWAKQTSLYTLIKEKLCDGTDIFEAFTWAMQSFIDRICEASHLLTALV